MGKIELSPEFRRLGVGASHKDGLTWCA